MSDASTELAERIAGLVFRFIEENKRSLPDAGSSPVEYLTAAEAAGFLRTSIKALEHWRARGGGPRWIKMAGNRVRYAVTDLRAYMAEGVQS